MLAHKAVHEGHVAPRPAAAEDRISMREWFPSVAYTDPEIAWVGGVTEDEASNT